MLSKSKFVANVGLIDVVGGKMWFCVAAENDERAHIIKYFTSIYFWTKKECEKYIRKGFSGDDKKYLLKKLKECKGRAILYK